MPRKTKGAPVAAYLRVSSASQSARMQRAAIDKASRARGDTIAHWYEDRFTGAGRHPPGLLQVQADARRGAVGRLYVYRLDRLSRRGIRDLLGIVQDLDAAGVELVTIADGFDLGGAARDIVLAVLAWAAQMERTAIAERLTAARARVEEGGGKWGRPRTMTPRMVAEAVTMHHDGKTVREIAIAMKVPRSTVARHLSPPHPLSISVPKTPRSRVLQK
jgi:DNA invertase Pin-like site-specific DNA recombinase